MPEVKKEVRTYKVRYVCDRCGIGDMEATGVVPKGYPGTYPHSCNHCGAFQTFDRQYPEIRLE
ncbi:hypothetical protein ACFSUS_26775 [Spirosoma soli]|uniref:Uncharacterized protein n=1 Tax=Spirosoma soli TaxID=1770529 RepID=A0ABW5MFD9_9BACT